MEDYLTWKNPDHTNFDPWLRVHQQLGGAITHICQSSRVIKASVEQWELWIGMPLPITGNYLIQEGLNPMYVDKNEGHGIYKEPNIWVTYSLK